MYIYQICLVSEASKVVNEDKINKGMVTDEAPVKILEVNEKSQIVESVDFHT